GFDSESALYVFVRWLTFTGIFIIIGVVAFHHVVLGFLRRNENPVSPMLAVASSRAATVGMWGAVGLGLVALSRLYAQSFAMHGGPQALGAALIGSMLGKTVWGWGWLLQVVAVLGAFMAFRGARRGSPAGWSVAAISAALLAFTPALSGHASSAPRLTPLAILADGIHVIGASGWLGSLLVVLVVGIPAAMQLAEGERGAAVAEVINAYSPTALVFAGIAAATGVFAAWLHIGTVSGLWQTEYGRTLLLKLGILSVVAGTGAYNWRRLKPALGDVLGAQRIRRSAGIEVAVALIVLAVTAVLVATPTAMDEQMMTNDAVSRSR
ncbi:MAG: copper resistance D family protein, partial [Gemmatimonadaceae bacterium]